jgi:uncharacterized protein YoxC
VSLTVALQISLLAASTAFVVLVACLIPIVFRVQRQIEGVVLTIVQAKSDLDELVEEGRELVGNVNTLVARASGPLEELERVAGTVRQWKGRAERLVNAVGVVVEAPVFRLARNVDLFRIGVAALLRVLSHRTHRDEAGRQTTGENNHV